MATLELTGRVLFLCNDPGQVERQLNGADLPGVTPDALKDTCRPMRSRR